MTERNVWITGSTGYLGAGFLQYLRLLEINCRPLDFRKSAHMDLCFNKSDILFHFGDPSTNDKMLNKELELEAQELKIQEFLEKTQMRSFYVSSSLVYGLKDKYDFKTGDSIKPFNAYTRMKARREEVFVSRGAKVLRVSNVYGGVGDSKSLIIRVIDHYLKGAPFNFLESNGTRDYIFVQDVYNAFFHSMESMQDRRKFLNIGTGKGSSVSKIKDIVEKELNSQVIRPLKIKFPKATSDRNVLDVSVDYAPKGWRPQTSLPVGISIEISNRRKYAE